MRAKWIAPLFALPLALAQNPAPESFAGSEMCAACHEEISKNFASNPHVAIASRKGLEERACESCHGPGAKHAESVDPKDILQPAKLGSPAGDQNCLGCHRNQRANTGRISAAHGRNAVSCAGCHSVHTPPIAWRTAADANKGCGACHTSARLDFNRPHAHRVNQGAVRCTDCHNPHSQNALTVVRNFTANEPGCLNCHGNLRGPFAYEHAPVRIEGCGACHEPHGSANPRMLKRADVSLLCLECHAGVTSGANIGGVPPAFHDLRSARFRNCTVCHVKVHGSHVNRALLR